MSQGIPTRHNGILYRSRLEARWGAFFSALGWPFEYKPFDLEGWIPDFLLTGARPCLVEVKPAATFDAAAGAKIVRARPEHDVLLLGVGPEIRRPYQYRAGAVAIVARLGWLWAERDSFGLPLARWHECFAGRGILFGRCDFSSMEMGWTGYMAGEQIDATEIGGIRDAWHAAGNATQWRGPENSEN